MYSGSGSAVSETGWVCVFVCLLSVALVMVFCHRNGNITRAKIVSRSGPDHAGCLVCLFCFIFGLFVWGVLFQFWVFACLFVFGGGSRVGPRIWLNAVSEA